MRMLTDMLGLPEINALKVTGQFIEKLSHHGGLPFLEILLIIVD